MTGEARAGARHAVIAATLRDEIAEGTHPPGARLPSEAQLSARFDVHRHTVRRAIARLVAEGLLQSRQGAGVFVCTPPPIEYRLGQEVSFSANLATSGRVAGQEALSIVTRAATADEAEALELPLGAPVVVLEGRAFADGQPLSIYRSVFAAERVPGIAAALTERTAVGAALKACGVTAVSRVSTVISASTARPAQAAALGVVAGQPLLRTDSINRDAQGRAIESARSWFLAERLVITVPGAAPQAPEPRDAEGAVALRSLAQARAARGSGCCGGHAVQEHRHHAHAHA